MQEQGTLPTQREPEFVNVRGIGGKGPQQVSNNNHFYILTRFGPAGLPIFIIEKSPFQIYIGEAMFPY